ncbi:MAG: hypothetical protein QME63_00090 [Actinomycetota bacterium]|nr:hypothetical protein [Actinomycetota bacterium]
MKKITLLIIAIAIAMISIAVVIPGPHSKQAQYTPLSRFDNKSLRNFVRANVPFNVTDVRINRPQGLVIVYYLNRMAKDENAAIFNAASSAEYIMPLLFKLPGVKKVKVVELCPFEDLDGNRRIKPAVSITFDKRIADRVNWGEIDSVNKAAIISLASEVFVHQAIRDDLYNRDAIMVLEMQQEDSSQLSNNH